MNTLPRSNLQIANLDQEIESAFSVFDKSTLNGAVCAAWAGEIYGATTFDHLSRGSVEVPETQFWELARDVEMLSLHRLELFLLEAGYERPDAHPYRSLGQSTADVFAVLPSAAYCKWIAPQITAALSDFDSLRDKLDGLPIGVELYEHEAAFAAAWDLLDEGFTKAALPLRNHLRRYGVSALA